MKKKKKPKGAQPSKKIIINKKGIKQLGVIIGLLALFFILSVNISAYLIRSVGKAQIVNFETAPTSTVIMVLGASVKVDGQPGDMLKDRLDMGIKLYYAEKAPYILITGDDGLFRANEIYVMFNYLVENGIPQDDIIIDKHGYRTYESCKRANEVYNIENAIIVTQKFHLPRALFICKRLNVTGYGVAADTEEYDRLYYHYLRDWLASSKAFIDTHILRPEPPVTYYEKN
jgi:SanA protein